MHRPELLAYPKDQNPHIAASPIEGGVPLPRPAAEVVADLDEHQLFPIAEDTTLDPDFYSKVDLDTRYEMDRKRNESLTRLSLLAECENDPETKEIINKVLPLFRMSLFEADYLNMAFEESSVPLDMLTSEEKSKFFKPFTEVDISGAHEMNARLFSVPSDIRSIAFQDLASMHEMLSVLDELNINEVSTSEPVLNYLHIQGFMQMDGNARLNLLREQKANIANIIREQRLGEEQIKFGDDKSKAKDLIARVIERKRLAIDCVDGNAFGFYSNAGTIIKPTYLFSDKYSKLLDEPMVYPKSVWQTVLHMMGGTYTFGHDHTYLYRNRDEEIPNSYIGTPPDYGVVRPGNFLFHDLKYVENSSLRANFPSHYLFEYVLAHYIHGMDLYTPNKLDGLPDNDEVDAYLYENGDNGHCATPLQIIGTHVIPFRALKKSINSEEYYEYGEECYLAELVDIALQCDLISAKSGREEYKHEYTIGGVKIGFYTNSLLNRLRTNTSSNYAFATAAEQVLFMQGLQAHGGSEAIINHYSEKLELSTLPVEQRYDRNGYPEQPKPPLSCYYEWFIRHARPVTHDELHRRGVPIRDPVNI